PRLPPESRPERSFKPGRDHSERRRRRSSRVRGSLWPSYHPRMGASSVELVETGRDALRRHAWQEAYEALTDADRLGPATGEGLRLLAEAAYWTEHPEDTVDLLERAFGAYLEEGDLAEAALTAFRVAEQHGMRMDISQAMGWAARAQR